MTEESIRAVLKTKSFGKKIYSFELLDSTNTFARSMLHEAEEGTLVIAEEQAHGRGRLGRSWASVAGKNLTFTLILKPQSSLEMLGILSLCPAIAVVQSIQRLTRLLPACKWPNDVLLNGKKLCGILSEVAWSNGTVSGIVMGIGININQAEFDGDLALSATSLALEDGRIFDRSIILAEILSSLEFWYSSFLEGRYEQIITTWKGYATMIGKQVSFRRGEAFVSGIAHDLDSDGGLLIRSSTGMIKVLADDISVIAG